MATIALAKFDIAPIDLQVAKVFVHVAKAILHAPQDRCELHGGRL